ncbi:MAG: hypothetical protein FD165_1966 [Gammaproteobacteria bacterium]|nr:MAG: hypothetical protein FD165_1966 [Gammaproteobacteria bacterium]TND04960.1 MAG: hypothetical protein FD120_1238 [Gammaproteobacteria bacterium]
MTRDAAPEDKRKYRRTPLKASLLDAGRVELRVGSQSHPLVRIVDLTPGGIGVHSPVSLKIGIAVEVTVAVGASPLSVRGTVCWCKPVSPTGNGIYRIGIVFDKAHLTRNLNFFVTLSKINIDLK